MQNVRHTVIFYRAIFLVCCVPQAQFSCADGYQLEDDVLVDSEAHCTGAKSPCVFTPKRFDPMKLVQNPTSAGWLPHINSQCIYPTSASMLAEQSW